MNTSELIERLHSKFERGAISEHDRCLIDDACRHMERLEAEIVSLKLVSAQSERLEKLEKEIEELGQRIYRVPYSK